MLKCSVLRETSKIPHLGLVTTVTDFFPVSFRNVTCVSNATKFINPTTSTSISGLFSGDNLLWLLGIGSLIMILLFVSIYLACAKVAGPRFYRPTPHAANLPGGMGMGMGMSDYPPRGMDRGYDSGRGGYAKGRGHRAMGGRASPYRY
jgi:hypothetical protein